MWLTLLALVWVGGMGLSFWDQDEAAYAGFAWRMLQTGNWIVPDFPWSEIHRKPPLHFWSIALSFRLFGPSEWAMRLPALLASAGTILLVRYRAAPVFGVETARLAAWILGANLFLPHLVRISVTDAPLLFFETLAALSLVRFLHTPGGWDRLWFVVGVAGGLLTKGPPVLILTLGMLGCLFLVPSLRPRIVAFHPWFLYPVAALPLLVWGRAAWVRDDGEFIRWMLDWYTLRRVSQEVLGQTGPPGYFAATLVVAFLPFAALLPPAVGRLLTRLRNRDLDFALLVLGAWLLAGWIIYEFMSSKLPAYAVGAYPALALVLARVWLGRMGGGGGAEGGTGGGAASGPWWRAGEGLQGLVGFALAGGALWFVAFSREADLLLSPRGRIAGVVLAFGVLLTTVGILGSLRRGASTRAFRLMLAQAVVFLGVGWYGVVPDLEPLRGSARDLVAWVAEEEAGARVVLSRNFGIPSLPLYLEWAGLEYREDPGGEGWLGERRGSEDLLLLDSRNLNDFEAAARSAGVAWEVVHSRAGWISDRGRHVEWYLVRGRDP